MDRKLLSIVVPTKNRQEYLKNFIDVFCSYSRENIELIIEDNSDNDEMVNFVKKTNDSRIIYHYESKHLSVVENSDRAINHSSGEYICFMGDDDLLSERVCEFVDYMKKEKIDSAIFQVAKYYWPGTEFKRHQFPNLIIRDFKRKIQHIDVDKERAKLLRTGATSLNMMPKVYHGIVKRERLDQLKEIAGTYFPGPSPDMANSVGLSFVLKNHVYCDIPFVSSGTSPKSTAGLGAKHKHEGNLKEVSFLPSDVEEKWCTEIPKVWTGPTIYLQSAIQALQCVGRSDLINMINYNYHYAYFVVFCPDYRPLFDEFVEKSSKYAYMKFTLAKFAVWGTRVKAYLNNYLLVKCKHGGILKTGVNNSFEAEKIIDSYIADINMEELFRQVSIK